MRWLFLFSFLVPVFSAFAVESSTSTPRLSAFDERNSFENRLLEQGMFILPHKPNYFLPFAYNASPNNAPYEGLPDYDGKPIDQTEVKFQLSLKARLWENPFGKKGNFYFGYTQLSMWQLYNQARSSPFRDTNYEPEFVFAFDTRWKLTPTLTNRIFGFGAVHQSNGREDPLSRSWNRIYALFVLAKGDFMMTVRPWYRLPEREEDDNNPDIEEYLGYGDVRLVYRLGKQDVSVLLRNNLRLQGDNKGAIELDYSFPLTRSLKGYVQLFDGYGESLIDYNHDNTRFGVGVAFTDWL